MSFISVANKLRVVSSFDDFSFLLNLLPVEVEDEGEGEDDGEDDGDAMCSFP